jgi:hypothetical protein
MSVPKSGDRRPAAHSPLRGLVASHPVVAFLVLAFGFGWISLIPILLSENGFGVLPIELPLTVVQTLATILGLALPAFFVTAAAGGREGVRDLLGRFVAVAGRTPLVPVCGLRAPDGRFARGDRFARRGAARGVRAELGVAVHRILAGRHRALPAHQLVGGARMDGFLTIDAAGSAGPCLRAS